MEKKLILYDPEEDSSYTVTLNMTDYERALIDEEYANSLLTFARKEYQEEINTTDAPENVEQDIEETSNVSESPCCSSKQGMERTLWTRNEILHLISLFKDNEMIYKNSTTRKDQFWSNIAAKLQSNKTSEQCRNKFKYLKSMYLKKKDNMSNRQTGSSKLNFTYFEEMDSIFNKEPIVTPLAIASSSEPTNDSDMDSHSEKENQPHKKKKTDATSDLLNFLKEKEIKMERRHQENIEKKEEALNICRQLLSVAEKLSKK